MPEIKRVTLPDGKNVGQCLGILPMDEYVAGAKFTAGEVASIKDVVKYVFDMTGSETIEEMLQYMGAEAKLGTVEKVSELAKKLEVLLDWKE